MERAQILPYGPRAVLVETPWPARCARALADLVGVEEVVPGACTVLVRHDGDPRTVARVRETAGTVDGAGPVDLDSRTVVIDVVYDGADLAAVGSTSGLSTDEVVALHTSVEYVVAFCGFAPGFAYLEGLPAELHVPRRSTPRSRVPAGSVAVAGPFSAVYPMASPGGWNLLGHTDVPVWDTTADPPALLAPGTRVRFRSVSSTRAGAT